MDEKPTKPTFKIKMYYKGKEHRLGIMLKGSAKKHVRDGFFPLIAKYTEIIEKIDNDK
jgi:hypothetical protein